MLPPHIPHITDLAIIGGGINGCGCAADAALRGLSVVLCEQDDLASKTSSVSSKLIHGGLRYLEQFDFSLVKHALDERQRLMDLAPHLVQPLQFIVPSDASTRPHCIVNAGLFLYDHLSQKNKLPHHQTLTRAKNSDYFLPLRAHYQKGFSYYDAQTEDSRLVITNALQAKTYGATILTETTVIAITVTEHCWELTLRFKNGDIRQLQAKALINASGAFVQIVNNMADLIAHHQTTLIQGTHLITPRWYPGEHAYLLQHPDKRVIFVLPYQTHYTLIGTTETLFTGDPRHVKPHTTEIEYLTQAIQHFFNHTLASKDILHVTSGIRALVSQNKNPRQMSRDWAYDYAKIPHPYISIYSGKLTTYRKLSEIILNHLAAHFPHIKPACTDKTPLPGATYHDLNFAEYTTYAAQQYAGLDRNIFERYLKTYGTLMEKFLCHTKEANDLGIFFGHTLYQAEVDYLIREEWANNIDDILWRRTKLGLAFTPQEKIRLDEYLKNWTFELNRMTI